MVEYKKKLMNTKDKKKKYYYLKIKQNGGKKIVSKAEYNTHIGGAGKYVPPHLRKSFDAEKKEKERLEKKKQERVRKVKFAEDCKYCGNDCQCVGHRKHKILA